MSNNMFMWKVWKPWFTFLLRYQHTNKKVSFFFSSVWTMDMSFCKQFSPQTLSATKIRYGLVAFHTSFIFEGGISQNSWTITLARQRFVNYFQGGNPKWLSCIIFELHLKIHYCHANSWSLVCVRYDIDVCVLHIKILS